MSTVFTAACFHSPLSVSLLLHTPTLTTLTPTPSQRSRMRWRRPTAACSLTCCASSSTLTRTNQSLNPGVTDVTGGTSYQRDRLPGDSSGDTVPPLSDSLTPKPASAPRKPCSCCTACSPRSTTASTPCPRKRWAW